MNEFAISQNLNRVDEKIRIENIKTEIEKTIEMPLICGSLNEMPVEMPVGMEESFWRNVLEFEKAPYVKLIDQITIDDGIPRAEEMTEPELRLKLWQIIGKLAELNVYLYHTNHLSDRELYTSLCTEILQEETKHLPGSACHIDILGSGSEDDLMILLKYYADEEERKEWQEDFPDIDMPERTKPPYNRDRNLPQFFEN